MTLDKAECDCPYGKAGVNCDQGSILLEFFCSRLITHFVKLIYVSYVFQLYNNEIIILIYQESFNMN